MSYHNPVLLHEAVAGLNIHANGVYVDVTFGGGGHAREILNQLDGGKLFAFDQDKDAQANKCDDERLTLIPKNFSFLKESLEVYHATPVDGILADLGVSSHQFNEERRGFSTRFDGPLDMRMDQDAGESALDIINEYSEESLAALFKNFGEVEQPRKLAKNIVKAREQERITTTGAFNKAIESCTPIHREAQYLAKVYQALRIAVNQELEVLKELLLQSKEVLKPNGRLVVISYHSLEDRLVKNFIKSGNFEGEEKRDFYGNKINEFTAINRHVITPSDEEIALNSRARSAKMRIAERK